MNQGRLAGTVQLDRLGPLNQINDADIKRLYADINPDEVKLPYSSTLDIPKNNRKDRATWETVAEDMNMKNVQLPREVRKLKNAVQDEYWKRKDAANKQQTYADVEFEEPDFDSTQPEGEAQYENLRGAQSYLDNYKQNLGNIAASY